MTRMCNTQHATLSNGGYRYVYEDEAGLRCTVENKTRHGTERQFWTHDALPNREFHTSEQVSACLDATPPEELASEAAKYPREHAVAPDACGNACRLCPRSPMFTADHKRIEHETWRFTLAESWQNFRTASLCDTHRTEFAGKPRELMAALDAEVAERKARAERNRNA